MTQAHGPDDPSERPCANCGAAGRGTYCSECGQRFVSEQDLSLRHFFLESLPHELFELDGRFLRTLRTLLLQPGMLACEFVAGRRRAYLDPLRFYVIAFLIHATLGSLLADHGHSLLDQIRQNNPLNILGRLAAARADVRWSDPALMEALRERARWLSELGTMVVFLGVAAVQTVVFFRCHRRYLEHVALALNAVSAYLVAMIVADAALGVFARGQFGHFDLLLQQWFAFTLLPLYWFLAIRRFYGLGLLPAFFGTLAVWAGNALIALCLNLVFLAILIETA